MNLAFVLHLYQPPTQSESALRAMVAECYAPLIKLLRSKTSCHFTLNVPLSLLEQLDKYGYSDLIAGIKELVDLERVELTGTAAYHPLLTKIPQDFAYKQIILNEYGLGYYFGQRQGFEGEISMLVKDIKGFFAPEMAVNEDLVKVLADLGYEWVLVDNFAVSENGKVEDPSKAVYSLRDYSTKIILRDSVLSNLLSFKRDGEVEDVAEYLLGNKSEAVVVALDGEVFGHHNKEGIYLLDTLLDRVLTMGINVTGISAAIDGISAEPLKQIFESTWSTEIDEKGKGKKEIYPYWEGDKEGIQEKQWQLLAKVLKTFGTKSVPKVDEGYENIPIWKESALQKLPNEKIRNFVAAELLVDKSMHSDQFWWASRRTVYDNLLYSPTMVKNALAIYKKITESEIMSDAKEDVDTLCSDIAKQVIS